MKENPLSIIDPQLTVDFSTNRADVFATLIKTLTGIAPGLSILSEAITQIIPNQKMERMADCLELFATKVRFLEEDQLSQKIQTAEFADLLEDVLTSASRALTPERREYLAELLKNSIVRDDLDHLGHKKILEIINQLNDAEIIILKFHYIDDTAERDNFQKLHDAIITGYELPSGASEDEAAKWIIFHEHHKVLDRLQLHPKPNREESLGSLVLRYAGLL